MNNYPPGMTARDWAHVNGDHLRDEVSDCCGAEMLGGGDDKICSECKEHCEAFEGGEDW